MSRITSRFESLKNARRTALITFITAGDPVPEATVPTLHALVAAGADVLEIGVPFSDPMADGPVIQRSSERALRHGTSLLDVLGMVAEFRRRDAITPVVLMGYLNPVEVMGYTRFAAAAEKAGVDGVITVDLPPEEADPLLEAFRIHGLAPIFLVSPTTSESRIQRICECARGFVYYVSLKGVTGSDRLDVSAVAQRISRIRHFTSLPVGVGFGIKDAASAKEVAAVSDAVVVGSAIVARMEKLAATPEKLPPELGSFVAELRTALDAA